MKNKNEDMKRQIWYLKTYLDRIKKIRKIILPRRPNLIKMLINFHKLKLLMKLTRRKLQKIKLHHC